MELDLARPGSSHRPSPPPAPLRKIRASLGYHGPHVKVWEEELILPNGRATEFTRIDVPPAVVVIPMTADGRFVMIRQFRPAIGDWLWEFPAGKLDPGESPLDGARRELEEETGYRSSWMVHIQDFYPCPGSLTESLSLFLALSLSRHRLRREPDELMRTRQIPVEQARRWLQEGRFRDAKTLVGLLLVLATLRPDQLPLSAARWPDATLVGAPPRPRRRRTARGRASGQ